MNPNTFNNKIYRNKSQINTYGNEISIRIQNLKNKQLVTQRPVTSISLNRRIKQFPQNIPIAKKVVVLNNLVLNENQNLGLINRLHNG